MKTISVYFSKNTTDASMTVKQFIGNEFLKWRVIIMVSLDIMEDLTQHGDRPHTRSRETSNAPRIFTK